MFTGIRKAAGTIRGAFWDGTNRDEVAGLARDSLIAFEGPYAVVRDAQGVPWVLSPGWAVSRREGDDRIGVHSPGGVEAFWDITAA